MPKVSFVMPTHNRIEWVAECVGSLLASSERDIELVIVDDGSTDGTYEMLTEWLNGEPRVKILRNETSIGAGLSRNKGTEAATSELIGVCDDDDFYSVDRAKKIIEFFAKNEGSIMMNAPYVSTSYFNEPVEKFDGGPFDEAAFKATGAVSYFSHPTAAYRKKDWEEVGGYRKEGEHTDDYQFVTDWIKAGKSIALDPEEYICFHRVLPNSIMAKHRGFTPEWVKPNGN